MAVGLSRLVKDVISRIEDRRVIGLATYRHYAQELMIYEKFGRCGFAISIIVMDGGRRVTQDLLVEAEARSKKGPFKSSGGTVSYMLLQEESGKKKLRVLKASYRSQAELFRWVNKVRDAFYRRIVTGEGAGRFTGRRK